MTNEQQQQARPAPAAAPAVIRKGPETLASVLKDEKNRGMLRAMLELPEGKKGEAQLLRYVAVAFRSCMKDPYLMKCPPMALFECIKDAALAKLEINGVLGHAYLVAYGAKPQLLLGYKGKIVLAMNSGKVLDIRARAVWRWDHFEVSMGSSESIVHRRGTRNGPLSMDNLLHAYAIADMVGGIQKIAVLDLSDIIDRRAISSGWKAFQAGKIKSTPWAEHPGPMAEKSAIHALCKHLPLSTTDRNYIERDVEDEGSDAPRLVDVSGVTDFETFEALIDETPEPGDADPNTPAPDLSTVKEKPAQDGPGGPVLERPSTPGTLKRDGGGPRQ